MSKKENLGPTRFVGDSLSTSAHLQALTGAASGAKGSSQLLINSITTGHHTSLLGDKPSNSNQGAQQPKIKK